MTVVTHDVRLNPAEITPESGTPDDAPDARIFGGKFGHVACAQRVGIGFVSLVFLDRSHRCAGGGQKLVLNN